MSKPRLLDLFCGAGGASVGYARAGFDVVGVDINPMPRYPFEFHQADAMAFPLDGFDVIHASPPCQQYSAAHHLHPDIEYPDLVAATRERLRATARPYVIENVPGAPLIDYVTVCGLALGLNVKRHRLFESSLLLLGTACPTGHAGNWLLVFGHTVLNRGVTIGRTAKNGPRIRRTHQGIEAGRAAMGIDWMNRDELSESIPPAYTEYIGRQVLAAIPT